MALRLITAHREPLAAVVLDFDPGAVPGLIMACSVKVPPGRREWLCSAALAASSEAQRITSSAMGQSRKDPAQVGADSADLLGATRVGDAGRAQREGPGCW